MPSRAAAASSSVPFSQATEAASQSTTTTTGSGVFSMTQRLQELSKGVATQHAKDERQKRVALEIKAFLGMYIRVVVDASRASFASFCLV